MENNKKLSTPSAIIVAGLLIAGAIFLVKMPARPAATNTTNGTGTQVAGTQTEQYAQAIVGTKSKITIPAVAATDHYRGDKNAKVVIVEYSDPECPFCKRFHTTMQDVVAKYNGKVAWVYRHFPIASLHSKARNEASALECAAKLGGEDAFWKYTDLLYKTTNSNDSLDPAQLPTMAKTIGLDVSAFNTCLSTKATDGIIAKAISDAEALGISGTPQSYILVDSDQYQIQGAYPTDAVEKAIDMILK